MIHSLNTSAVDKGSADCTPRGPSSPVGDQIEMTKGELLTHALSKSRVKLLHLHNDVRPGTRAPTQLRQLHEHK